MKKDLKSMANHTTPVAHGPVAQPPTSVPDPAQIEQMAQQFAGKSEEELMSELVQRVSAQKKTGTLTDDQFDRFMKQASPMLNREQAAKMRAIIDKLKG